MKRSKSPQSPIECMESESLEHSESELEIDINATLTPRKSLSPILMKNGLDIIETFENDIEKQLNKTADKFNLNVTNVKTIIRQVLTNEYDKRMLLEGLSGGNNESLPKYEVKLTRAKAKEIMSSNPSAWVPQLLPPETQVLIARYSAKFHLLQSEDLRDKSVANKSDSSSLPPPMPMCMEDQATRTTSYIDDGRLTETLEGATKHTDDDNILGDDEINHQIIIKKEEIKLCQEVYQHPNNVSGEYDDVKKEVLTNSSEDMNDSLDINASGAAGERVETSSPNKNDSEETKKMFDFTVTYGQLCIIEHQMRQHVQLLTQNLFLSYEHPEFHENSHILKECLLNLKDLSEGKTLSVFRPVNLNPALDLIDSWIELCASNCEAIRETREHVQQELKKSIDYKMAGNWQYIVTFPKLILEKIAKSNVFLYPYLLPKIPYKSQQFSGGRGGYTNAEDNLLVFGLEQFKHFLSEHKKTTKITLKEIVSYVQEYMMPHRSKQNILKHIHKCKHPSCLPNPIQQYILHGKLKPVIHYIYPFHQMIAPCNRMPDELPRQWKDFIFPVTSHISQVCTGT